MYRNFYLSVLSAGLLAAAASCSSDEPALATDGATTFKIQLPGDVGTRALADGNSASQLYVAVYAPDKADGTKGDLLISNFPGALKEETAISIEGFNNLEATVTIDLVKNMNYNIVFWAQSYTESTPYTYNATDRTITVSYEGAVSGDDNRDAFYAYKSIAADGAQKNITLLRPFAQVNIATADLQKAKVAGTEVTKAGVTFSSLANTFDLTTGTASGSTENVVFAAAELPEESLSISSVEYSYLTMAYVLAGDQGTDKSTISTVGLFINDESSESPFATYPNIPVQRNYRTNIYGNLLTNAEVFNVTIEPDFGKTDINEPQDMIPVDGVYTVSSPSQLLTMVDMLENGHTFEGETIELANDIDMAGIDWKPNGSITAIQGTDADKWHAFQGVFDGKGKTIRNLTCKNSGWRTMAGFIGVTTGAGFKIKNLTLENPVLEADYVGGIVAYMSTKGGLGTTDEEKTRVENCHIIGGTMSKANHGGCIAGYVQGHQYFKNCSVTDTSISAEKAGGIFGSTALSKITDCTLTNVTINGTNSASIWGNQPNTYQVINSTYTNVTVNGELQTEQP